MRYFLNILFACLSVPLSAQELSDGVDRILRGAAPGTTIEAFQLAHPKAANPEATQEGAEPAKEATYLEEFDKDPLLGLQCFANYGFRDGRLREFVLLWGGSQEDINNRRKQFFEACFWKHGREFRREVMQVNQRAENPPMVPVLVWEEGSATYIASLAWHPNAERAPGTLTYAMYAKEDPFLDIVLIGDELAPEVVADVWAELSPLVSELQNTGTAPQTAE